MLHALTFEFYLFPSVSNPFYHCVSLFISVTHQILEKPDVDICVSLFISVTHQILEKLDADTEKMVTREDTALEGDDTDRQAVKDVDDSSDEESDEEAGTVNSHYNDSTSATDNDAYSSHFLGYSTGHY